MKNDEKTDQHTDQTFYKSFVGFFTNKKTVKGVNITYQVVWNLILLFLITVLIGVGVVAGIGAGYFASLVKDESPHSYESMKRNIYDYEETSEVYFADNKYLGKLRTDLEREEVQIEDVSKHLIDAVISTEDEYFWEHNGVVPKAILRAVFQEVTNSAVQTGGSTLTQQLIKNQILTNEVSFDRKAKEILLALRLENFFEKEEILEAYLNVSPLGRNSSGRNIAGVQTAAKGIFGVDASELNIPQAAFIAGLPQSPSAYTPFRSDGTLKSEEGLAAGLNRMKTVLTRMERNETINKKQLEEALAYDIVADFIPPRDNPLSKYPFLTFEVEKRTKDILAHNLAKEDGYLVEDLKNDEDLFAEYLTLADRNLRQNGYEIHTTIDKKIYDGMQQATADFQFYGSDKTEMVKNPETGEMESVVEPVETGALLMENKTGKIISFVGGRDFKREQTNHATTARRSNGSTMKPLAVYAPALELGAISPGTIIPDVELDIVTGDGKKWAPKNYDWRYNGLVSARTALTRSFNVSAARIYLDIIDQRPVSYLEKMGFEALTEIDYQVPALSLGGITNGVTVEENVNAFSTFGNGGQFVDAYMIDKILDKKGNIIYEHEVESVDVFSPQTSYLLVDMLRDVVTSGTGASMNSRLKFRADWAGKTGTGQDWHDSWFVATNPNVTFGVWNGYDTPKPLEKSYKGHSYGSRNIYLWAEMINAAYDVNPDLVAPSERFKMPGGIVSQSYCTISGLLPSEGCRKAGFIATDLFNAKFVPTEVDDSLIDGNYVQVDDKKYLALDTTPDDFTIPGVILNPEFIKSIDESFINDPSQLIPNSDKWDGILVADDILEENGQTPAIMTITGTEKEITWQRHAEKDIIGYRVYELTESGNKKIVSIPEGEDRSFKGSDGQYYVTAVDIAGNESPASNLVQIGKAEIEEDPPLVDEKDPNDKPPIKPPTEPGDGKDPIKPPTEPGNGKDPIVPPTDPDDDKDPVKPPTEPGDDKEPPQPPENGEAVTRRR